MKSPLTTDRRPRLMVVEDEAIVAADLGQTLRTLGYEVVATAATGEEAVDLAVTVRPDAVLMDIRLGKGMDGIAATAQIRDRVDIPVIFLTAHTDRSTLQRAQATEPSGYLVKPFEDRMLEATVQMALYRRQKLPGKNELTFGADRPFREYGIND